MVVVYLKDATIQWLKIVTVCPIFTNQTFFNIKNPLRQCFMLLKGLIFLLKMKL